MLRFGAAVSMAAVLCAASPSSLFSLTEPGSWEIARSGAEPVRLCLVDPAVLAQFEHRNAKCKRSVVRDSRSEAVIHYSCRGGSFGQSRITLLTPRSLRVETQGISANAPFKYTFQARRVGDCGVH